MKIKNYNSRKRFANLLHCHATLLSQWCFRSSRVIVRSFEPVRLMRSESWKLPKHGWEEGEHLDGWNALPVPNGGRPFLSPGSFPPYTYISTHIPFLISGFSRRWRINGRSRARDIYGKREGRSYPEPPSRNTPSPSTPDCWVPRSRNAII